MGKSSVINKYRLYVTVSLSWRFCMGIDFSKLLPLAVHCKSDPISAIPRPLKA